jgi:hypothetical protein
MIDIAIVVVEPVGKCVLRVIRWWRSYGAIQQ